MYIEKLDIKNFRNIENISISLKPHLNVIYGQNGSGKTSILEAFHTLVRNTSFRTHQVKQTIKDGTDQMLVHADLVDDFGTLLNIKIKKSKLITDLSLNGEKQNKLSNIAKKIPILLISENFQKLLKTPPTYRRKFIDWGVFHVEHSYQNNFIKFDTALKQRNSALGDPGKLLEIWDEQVALYGQILTSQREIFINELSLIYRELSNDYIFLKDSEIVFNRGWPDDESLHSILRNKYKKDLKLRYTSLGPHRFDFTIRTDGKDLSPLLSNGQQKILTILLQLSQSLLVHKKIGIRPIVLCDDIFSELDDKNTKVVIDELLLNKHQLILTSIDNPELLSSADIGLFHVEHGNLV